ncbi:hypothetical protein ACFU44_33370 [Nocardia rhizosphaerihabitans]|uniref:hypothetical protein n=1 Tax=Nocardia rhizosphaerihabitans TaxID=1691570 RepID=UPI00366B5C88
MHKVQLEARVNEIVAHVVSGGKVEDDHIELKRTWPEDDKAGQLAGAANKAGGQPILWIIGLCEGSHQVVDLKHTDPANWWQQMQGAFAFDVAPSLTHHGFMTQHGYVVALLFETDRAPYLVKLPKVPKDPNNPASGYRWASNAVPWREGTSVRSATRAELLSILAPLAALPKLDLVDSQAALYEPAEISVGTQLSLLVVEGTMLIDAPPSKHVLYPTHRHNLTVTASDGTEFEVRGGGVKFGTSAEFRAPSHPPSGVFAPPPRLKAVNQYGASDQPAGLVVLAPDVVTWKVSLAIESHKALPLYGAHWLDVRLTLPISSSSQASVIQFRIAKFTKLRATVPATMKLVNSWGSDATLNEVRVDSAEEEQVEVEGAP